MKRMLIMVRFASVLWDLFQHRPRLWRALLRDQAAADRPSNAYAPRAIRAAASCRLLAPPHPSGGLNGQGPRARRGRAGQSPNFAPNPQGGPPTYDLGSARTPLECRRWGASLVRCAPRRAVRAGRARLAHQSPRQDLLRLRGPGKIAWRLQCRSAGALLITSEEKTIYSPIALRIERFIRQKQHLTP